MKKLFFSLLLALATMTLFQGCAAKMELVGLQVELVKLERKADGSLLASLLFTNPNIASLNLAKSTHQLSLNGVHAGELVVTEPIGVPALQTATLTATFRPVNGFAGIAGTVSYQLASQLTFNVYGDDREHYKTHSSGTVMVQ